MEEKLSVAPMMDWTNPHFRHLLRLVSTKTVLYTEMAVDNTVIYNTDGFLEERIGLVDPDGPAVIQLGGSDPDSLARASEILNDYGILSNHYQIMSRLRRKSERGRLIEAIEPHRTLQPFASQEGTV